MMAAQQQQQYMDSKQDAYISFAHSEQGGTQGLPDPQQTELLHVSALRSALNLLLLCGLLKIDTCRQCRM